MNYKLLFLLFISLVFDCYKCTSLVKQDRCISGQYASLANLHPSVLENIYRQLDYNELMNIARCGNRYLSRHTKTFLLRFSPGFFHERYKDKALVNFLQQSCPGTGYCGGNGTDFRNSIVDSLLDFPDVSLEYNHYEAWKFLINKKMLGLISHLFNGGRVNEEIVNYTVHHVITSNDLDHLDLFRIILSWPQFNPSFGKNEPLHLAVTYDKIDFVKLILSDKRFDPSAGRIEEIIQLSCSYNNPHILRLMVFNWRIVYFLPKLMWLRSLVQTCGLLSEPRHNGRCSGLCTGPPKFSS